jgi:hypothetical protein
MEMQAIYVKYWKNSLNDFIWVISSDKASLTKLLKRIYVIIERDPICSRAGNVIKPRRRHL